jgi:hypothetical protein
MTDETKTDTKTKRTRRAITPETALANVINTLGKLQPPERERVLAAAREWFAERATQAVR